jgi:hypothetical protein
MVDDVHRLRQKQRRLLIDELAVLRPRIPIWLAERTIALGDELLSQGVRQGRDVHEYTLEDLWSGRGGHVQFQNFAFNVLDRRMVSQNEVPIHSFSQCLRSELTDNELHEQIQQGIKEIKEFIDRREDSVRYRDWFSRAETLMDAPSIDSLIDLFVTRILVARDEGRRQMSFDLALTEKEHDDRDSPQVRGAAEVMAHEEIGVPYYFGQDRICTLATFNIEELLMIAAALFTGLQSKQVLRVSDLVLSPIEQEILIKKAAAQKFRFIPKNHSEGSRAQRLLEAVGVFCRAKTFSPSAPYAPGVTGIRLSRPELIGLDSTTGSRKEARETLRKVISECVSENLLITRESSASTSRDAGTVFYLNRTLCAHYGLPLQFGGWQDVPVTQIIEWMEQGPSRRDLKRLENVQ